MRAILERAPALDHWEFYEYRLAEDLVSAQVTVEGRNPPEFAQALKAVLGLISPVVAEEPEPEVPAEQEA